MREAIRLEQSSAIAYAVLGQFCLAQNRFADAKTILEEARSRKLESSILRTAIFSLAFLADDVPGMDQQVRSAAGKPGAEDLLLSALRLIRRPTTDGCKRHGSSRSKPCSRQSAMNPMKLRLFISLTKRHANPSLATELRLGRRPLLLWR